MIIVLSSLVSWCEVRNYVMPGVQVRAGDAFEVKPSEFVFGCVSGETVSAPVIISLSDIGREWVRSFAKNPINHALFLNLHRPFIPLSCCTNSGQERVRSLDHACLFF